MACRVCSLDDALNSAITKATRVCATCMRQDVLHAPDGRLMRFCYEHRLLEPLEAFKENQTRCMKGLRQLRERRARAKKKDNEGSDGSTASEVDSTRRGDRRVKRKVTRGKAAQAGHEDKRVCVDAREVWEMSTAAKPEQEYRWSEFAVPEPGKAPQMPPRLLNLHGPEQSTATDNFGEAPQMPPRLLNLHGPDQSTATDNFGDRWRAQALYEINAMKGVALKVDTDLNTDVVREMFSQLSEEATNTFPEEKDSGRSPRDPGQAMPRSSQSHGVFSRNDVPSQGLDLLDFWLTPGSIILHVLSKASDDENVEEEIDALSKRLVKGKLFDVCDAANPGATCDSPIHISLKGRCTRVNRDGSTRTVHQLDPNFLEAMNSTGQVTFSSHAVRVVDIRVPRVPPEVKFEAKFHGETLLRVEEVSRSPSDGPGDDVVIRVTLPNTAAGVARVEAVWAEGPCRNMPTGAGFPLMLLPSEEVATQVRQWLFSGENASAYGIALPRQDRRRFIEHLGYVLHAARLLDNDLIQPLHRLYDVARDIGLGLLCDVIADALDRQELHLVEDMSNESDWAESVPDVNVESKTEAPRSLVQKIIKSITRIPLYFLLVRPGSLMWTLLFFKDLSQPSRRSALCWLLVQFALDMIFHRKFISTKFINNATGGKVVSDSKQSFKFGAVWQRFYMAITWHAGVYAMMYLSPSFTSYLAQLLVYETTSRKFFVMLLVFSFSKVKVFSEFILLQDVYNHRIFSLFVLCLCIMLNLIILGVQCFAYQYGSVYYKGDYPLPSIKMCAFAHVCWAFGMIVMAILGRLLSKGVTVSVARSMERRFKQKSKVV